MRDFLKQGGPRRIAMQELLRISLLLRKQEPMKTTDMVSELTQRLKARL